MSTRFKKKFAPSDFKPGSKAEKYLGPLEPEVDAELEFESTVTAVPGLDQDGNPVLHIKAVPYLTKIKANRIRIKGKHDLKLFIEPLLELISGQRDLIAGVVSRANLASMPIPSRHQLKNEDLQKIAKNLSKQNINLEIKPLDATVSLPGVAFLVEDNYLRVLAQVLVNSEGTKVPAVPPTFPEISSRINGLIESQFQVTEEDEIAWIAVRKDLIASTVSDAVATAQPCASSALLAGDLDFNNKIEIPPGSSMQCSADFNCDSDRNCPYQRSEDKRDCYRCLVPSPRICTRIFGRKKCIGGGGCITKGEEPVCVAARTAQNAIYTADAERRKAQCNVERETEKGVCLAKANTQKALCDGARTTLDLMRAAGQQHIGRLKGDVKYDATSVRACVPRFDVSPKIDQVNATIAFSGKARVEVDVHFTPLDVLGNYACTFPWSTKKATYASLTENLHPAAAISYQAVKEGVKLDVAPSALDIALKLKPSPFEMIVTSPEMMLSCSKPPFSFGVALAPFFKEMRGDIRYTLNLDPISFVVPITSLKVGDRKILAKPEVTETAFVISGALAPAN